MGLPRDDLAALEGLPEELLDILVRDVVAELFLHVHLPAKDLLVGEAVHCVSLLAQRWTEKGFHLHTHAEDRQAHTEPPRKRGKGRIGWNQQDLWKPSMMVFPWPDGGHTGRVRRCVTALMVTVDGDVKTQVLGEVIVITETKHIHVVPCSSVSIPLP